MGEELLQPDFAIYHQSMLNSETASNKLAYLPLSNDAVRRRNDEIATDVQSRLSDILRYTKFLLAFNESTVRVGKAPLLLGCTWFKHASNSSKKYFFASL